MLREGKAEIARAVHNPASCETTEFVRELALGARAGLKHTWTFGFHGKDRTVCRRRRTPAGHAGAAGDAQRCAPFRKKPQNKRQQALVRGPKEVREEELADFAVVAKIEWRLNRIALSVVCFRSAGSLWSARYLIWRS